jgi:hypothetical protein
VSLDFSRGGKGVPIYLNAQEMANVRTWAWKSYKAKVLVCLSACGVDPQLSEFALQSTGHSMFS